MSQLERGFICSVRWTDCKNKRSIVTRIPCFNNQKAKETRLIECGDNLGDMTNELRPGEYIEEFVSGGPNNYAYTVVNFTTNKTKNVCKGRGITLNYTAFKLMNYDVIKDFILRGDETDKVAVHTEKNIKLKRGDGRLDIIIEPEDKNVHGVLF